MRLTRNEGGLLLTIDGGKANALSPALLAKLNALLDEVETEPPGPLTITGYDTYFSAGLALPILIDYDRDQMRHFVTSFGALITRFFLLPRPVIAAINGHAVAGGCVLALQADYRLMVDDAKSRIGLNEVAIGISLPHVVTETLRCQVPAHAMRRIAQFGQLFSPSEAKDLQLVDQVVPRETLLAQATTQALAFAKLSLPAFAQTKASVRQPTRLRIEASAGDQQAWLDSWFSEPAKQVLRAAVAKIQKKNQ